MPSVVCNIHSHIKEVIHTHKERYFLTIPSLVTSIILEVLMFEVNLNIFPTLSTSTLSRGTFIICTRGALKSNCNIHFDFVELFFASVTNSSVFFFFASPFLPLAALFFVADLRPPFLYPYSIFVPFKLTRADSGSKDSRNLIYSSVHVPIEVQ